MGALAVDGLSAVMLCTGTDAVCVLVHAHP